MELEQLVRASSCTAGTRSGREHVPRNIRISRLDDVADADADAAGCRQWWRSHPEQLTTTVTIIIRYARLLIYDCNTEVTLTGWNVRNVQS